MTDHGFLRPVFWEFWDSKIEKQSSDTGRSEKLEQLEAALGRKWKDDEFYDAFIAPYATFPFGPQELQTVAEIQSEWIHSGIFQFQVRTQAVEETALKWTFVNVINLDLDECHLLKPFPKAFPPFGQCHFCGSTLENRKASSKFCHWDSCLTGSTTPNDHKHQNASCCHSEWIDIKRSFKARIKRRKNDQGKVIKIFQEFLEKRYAANKENKLFMPPKGSLVADAFHPFDFAYRASLGSFGETVAVTRS